MKKIISTFAAVLVAASVTTGAAAAVAFHANVSGTQQIKKGTETVYSIDATYKPEVYTGNAKVATTKFWYQSGNRYFYKLNASGNVGSSTGVYAGTKSSKSQIFVAKVGSPTLATSTTVPSSVKCSASGTVDLSSVNSGNAVRDTQGRVTSGYSGGTFFFTVDAPAGAVVSSGNAAVGYVEHVYDRTYSYTDSGVSGASTGIYVTINGQRSQLFTVKNGNINYTVYNKSQDQFADELLALINAQRDKLEQFSYIDGELVSTGHTKTHAEKCDYLMKAAAVRAKELATDYSHTRPSGTLGDLVSSFGGTQYGAIELIATADNVNGSQAAYNIWLASEMHKNGMEDGSNTEYGAAYYDVGSTRYFVIVFAS